MSTALVTIAVGNDPFYEHTLPRLAQFAAWLGAEFHSISDHDGSCHPTWLKLTRLPALLDRFDRIVLCDSDALPNLRRLTDADREELLDCPGLCAVPDMGMPRTDERFVRWCARYLGRNDAPTGRPYFNAGFVVLTRAAAAVLAARAHALPALIEDYFHDQDLMNHAVLAEGIAAKPLRAEWNWMAPQFADAALRMKLIHFAGGHKKLIPHFARLTAHATNANPQIP